MENADWLALVKTASNYVIEHNALTDPKSLATLAACIALAAMTGTIKLPW